MLPTTRTVGVAWSDVMLPSTRTEGVAWSDDMLPHKQGTV